MASSVRPYQDSFRKGAKTENVFRKPKDMVRHDVLDGERKERMRRWIHFFRQNPHRFIQDYFGIHLYPYQILMIWVLQRSSLAYIVASRAAAKTWIIAVWSLTLAVLYPGIKIVVCAKTLKQGGIILSEKLVSLRDKHPNVAREIKSITCNANSYEAIFQCGSSIKVTPSSESSRGLRANYIIIEEARLVPREILESVIKPFLEVRTPNFRSKPEYRDNNDYREDGVISYITSAWYTAEYWYTYVKACIKRMANGDNTANFLAFDYLISLFHNIKTEEMIRNEMADNDAISMQMEYLNIPAGTSSKAYYKPSMFPRTLKQAFYPQKEDNYNPKHNPYQLKPIENSITIISSDIATRSGKANDLSINSVVRLVGLSGKGYERQLIYQEAFKGINTVLQAKRIKELFHDANANFIVMDLMNAGVSVFDSLSQATACDERNVVYPPMTVVNDPFVDATLREELLERTLGLNALPVIYPIRANQSSNAQMYSQFRSALQKKLWKFLLPEGDAEQFLIKTNKEFMQNPDDSTNFGFFMNPYIQTSLFIGECINLDMSLVGGIVKLSERPGTYKDRFSSIIYCNSVVAEFDKALLKESKEDNWDEFLQATQVWG